VHKEICGGVLKLERVQPMTREKILAALKEKKKP